MFPDANALTSELFYKLYSNVACRCFGYGVPYTCLCPVADFHNHNTTASSSYEVVNKTWHLKNNLLDKSVPNNTYFTLSKFMNDYSVLFEAEAAAGEAQSVQIQGTWDREAWLKRQVLQSVDFQR